MSDGTGTTSTTTDEPRAEGRTELKRVMGPKLLLLFIVGDILGTGVYALTGDVAAEVGGAAWAPFIAAFAVAMVTAFSYFSTFALLRLGGWLGAEACAVRRGLIQGVYRRGFDGVPA